MEGEIILIEETLVLIKPDAVIGGNSEEIKDFLISKNMDIIKEQAVWFKESVLRSFYEHVELRNFIEILKLFSRNFAVVLILRGENALSVAKEAKSFFRKKYDYGYYGCTIHSPDSKKEYKKELSCLLRNNIF